jgi:hypothetical protein
MPPGLYSARSVAGSTSSDRNHERGAYLVSGSSLAESVASTRAASPVKAYVDSCIALGGRRSDLAGINLQENSHSKQESEQ